MEVEQAKGCQCACHLEPKHSTLQDYAQANQFHIKKMNEAREEVETLKEENEALSREIEYLRMK